MRAIVDIMRDLENDGIQEDRLAELINELTEKGMSVSFYYVQHEEGHVTWMSTIEDGSDLTYFGDGKTAAKAIASALSDWYNEYDTQ